VDVSLVDGQIVIKPVAAQAWSLEQLLAGVTSKNLHHETDTGDAVGIEVW
jgi:antitoxin MazE